ncbi:inner membrane transport protein YbaT [Microbulbifer aestuariivivens]|uniref:Inner membrane transport protein YbaT n=1 Tax=Microbulbifer aestuariivivens TaxID=1908308 RepID=A0ABP9WRZ1_9GAMM
MRKKGKSSISFLAIVSIGIGSMVGAGIFALMGIVGEKIGAAAILSFAISGIVAALAAYSYAKMGARFPSNGGIVEFLVQGFGGGTLAGTLSLMYYVTLLVASALVAKTFGHYASDLATGSGAPGLWVNVFASSCVLGLALVNAVSAHSVGRLETVIVLIKMSILVIFTLAIVPGIDPALLDGAHKNEFSPLMIGTLGLTFLAYAGFGIMTNAGEDVANPSRTIPFAMFTAIGIVIALYIAIGVAVFGSMSAGDIIKYKETVLAHAAEPLFGHMGFVFVSIAALLATASALNSNLFGELNTSYMQATLGQLPEGFNRNLWHNATLSFVGSITIILLLVNYLSLHAIASINGATFLLCYLAVQIAHYRVAEKTNASRVVILLGIIALALVTIAFLIETTLYQPTSAILFFSFLLACWLIERWYLSSRRRLRPTR